MKPTDSAASLSREDAKEFNAETLYELDIERALIASIFRDPLTGGDALYTQMVSAKEQALRTLESSDFVIDEHKTIWAAMQWMYHHSQAYGDLVCVASFLKDHRKLESAGGSTYLAELFASHFSPIGIVGYVDRLRKKQSLRRLHTVAVMVIERTTGVWSSEDLPERVGDWMVDQATKAKLHAAGLSDDLDSQQVMQLMLDSLGDAEKNLIATGVRDLDHHLVGFGRGEMIVIGGRPSMGKSTLVRQIGANIAIAGHGVGIIALEEKPQKIGRNMISNLASVENWKLRKGEKVMTPEEKDRVFETAKYVSTLNIRQTENVRDINEILVQIDRWKSQYGIEVVIVDYLQRVTSDDRNDLERVSRVSRELSDAFKKYDVCGLVTAQLNRAVEHRDEKIPTMADLRASGQIEQDADGILLIHRPDYYVDKSKATGKVDLIIAKWRDGERNARVILHDELQFQRFGPEQPAIPNIF